MRKQSELHEFKMPQKIRAIVRAKGCPVPKLHSVSRALETAKRRDPDAFSTSGSRETVVQDVAADFIARYEKRKQLATKKILMRGEWIMIPPGTEYSILTAARIRPYVESFRKSYWKNHDPPYKTVEEAEGFLEGLWRQESAKSREAPVRIKVTFTLEMEARSYVKKSVFIDDHEPQQGETMEQWLDFAKQRYEGSAFESFVAFELPRPKLRLMKNVEGHVINTEGRGWQITPGEFSEVLMDFCRELANSKAPTWGVDGVLTHLLVGALPSKSIETSFEFVGDRETVIGMRFTYPVSGEQVLKAYGEAQAWLDSRADADKRLKPSPKALSDYQLRLILLVYELPEDRATWPDRLRRYLELYREDIELGFMPDLGLKEEGDRNDKERWNNAWRNLRRDYKAAQKKIV